MKSILKGMIGRNGMEHEKENNEMNEERMEQHWTVMHGHRGDESWQAPKVVMKSDKVNRADQGSQILANEFMDDENVLREKMLRVAQFMRSSKCCVAYTGAGLSRAAGISDYASAKNSVTNSNVPKLRSNLDAQPTYAHRVLAATERAGFLHQYVQQNHDGLPQKAGFPQAKLNEIHGAWFDPSNPVVQFSGNLRSDLFNWMLSVEQDCDLCLCLGTSLSGMNADRCARTPAKKMIRADPNTIGTVIINLQQTPLDDKTAIRVWARLDDAFKILAEALELDMTPIPVQLPEDCGDRFQLPYNRHGKLDNSKLMTLDLRKGREVRIAEKDACNYKERAMVLGRTEEGDYLLRFQSGARRILGKWWILEALSGSIPSIPITNTEPKVRAVSR